MHSTTESASAYSSLSQLSAKEILAIINQEDQTVPLAVEKALPQIEKLALAITEKLRSGGRLFYIGAGTSGRLGIVDASECPPTYGVPHEMVIGLIAGGDSAIRKAVENAEDDMEGAERDFQPFGINPGDIVVGIAASGRTPYVVGGLRWCRSHGISTGCVVCNAASAVAAEADFPVEVIVGPEVVSGSTRMKSGTAQKLVLNMLTTTAMIGLGKVRGNRMTHMQLSNQKLRQRALRMIGEITGLPDTEALPLLEQLGSVEAVVRFVENR